MVHTTDSTQADILAGDKSEDFQPEVTALQLDSVETVTNGNTSTPSGVAAVELQEAALVEPPENANIDMACDNNEHADKPEDESSSKTLRRLMILVGLSCVVAIIAVVVGLVVLKEEETSDLYFNTKSGDPSLSDVREGQPRLQIPVAGYERPDFSKYPIYEPAYRDDADQESKEMLRHLHVHALTMTLSEEAAAEDPRAISGIFSDNPDGILEVIARGNNTGSGVDFFEIGTRKTKSVPAEIVKDDKGNSVVFDFDQRIALLFLPSGTDSFDFTIWDKDFASSDDVISQFTVEKNDLPALGEDWVTFSKVSTVEPHRYPILTGAIFTFKVKVTEGFIVEKSEYEGLFEETATRQYREHVLDLASGDHALAQTWTHTVEASATAPRQAVLWIIGRNDGFMHPHVAKSLFFDRGIDLFVLNWRYNGLNLRYGFIDDPIDTSHNPIGDINLWNEEVGLILELIQSYGPYDSLLGYGHSTGGLILSNYVIENGDNEFDAFILNSPLLDWDEDVLAELLLDRFPSFQANSAILQSPDDPPEVYANDPLTYLNQTIIPHEKRVPDIYTLYYTDWTTRPQYAPATTVGFVRAANGGFDKINSYDGDVTSKPLLVLSSFSDSTLSSTEIGDISLKINKQRTLIAYRYNNHDVFLSFQVDDNLIVIQDVQAFLEENFYYA